MGGVRFTDALGFYRFARELGAEGVQTPLVSRDPAAAHTLRQAVEETGGYYEAELSLPKREADLAEFETDVRLAREAGATVARSYFTVRRRYEVFQTRADFDTFAAQARRSIQLATPLLRRHGLRLAIENHKDFTTGELIALLLECDRDWIGLTVDTGNNIALLEEPHETVEALAPFAWSVHLKDMAVQPSADGFLLSEVPLGTGMLDLRRMVAALRRANPAIVLNLEMATRDPIAIPCLAEAYYTTFPPDYHAHKLGPALERVQAHPPRGPIPDTAGKPIATILAEEEAYNRDCLAWMHQHLSS